MKVKTLSIGHLTYDINLLLDSYPIEGSKTSTKEIINCSGGSASIVAYALAKWNMESFISGVIGYDEYGNAMRKDMEDNKVHTNYLETNYDIKTPTSYIISNKQNHNKTIITAQKDEINIKKYEYDQDIDCVIVDGHEYNASVYAFNKYAQAISILNAKTPRKVLLDFFKYAKFVVCSLEVAEAMTGIKIDFNTPITMSNAYKKITDKYPNINLLIRMEGKGCIYEINGEIKVLADIKDDTLDTTGAHDCFVAAIAYGLTNKYDLETTIRLATIASNMAKKTIGATLAIPKLSDVISFYESKFGKLNLPNVEGANAPTA
jgi:ribokinase